MENTDTKIITARKQHRCDKCQKYGAIMPKDKYMRITQWQENDYPTYWKVCNECQKKG